MALLTSLEYFGIRSVPGNSQDKHKIDFETPLTIIFGPNGSGKTTLIEALKYITAGETPPGDKYAFVHNPRIARTSRVDAFIGLEFKTEKNLKATVVKRFNAALAKTKSGMQFKSDEGTIHVQNIYGEVKSLSSKTADFQSEVLKLLGVPAAILSNVIFCHQEDSCWPLSEPKELKTRFDKIFQLQKFTKAIEQAKKIRKEQANNLKVLDSYVKRDEIHLRLKGKYLKEKKESHLFITENKELFTQLTEQNAALQEEINKLESELRTLQANKGKHDVLKAELKVLNENVYSLSQDVVSFEGSLEELQELAEKANREVENEGQSSSVQQVERIVRQIDVKKREKEQCQQQLNEVIRKKTNYYKAMEDLSDLDAAMLKRFPFLEGCKALEAIPKAIAERQDFLKNAMKMHETARKELEQNCFACQSQISTVNAEISSLKNQKRRAEADISSKQNYNLTSSQIKEEHNRVKEELKKTRKELAPLNTISDLYDNWANETAVSSCCPLCERKFPDKTGAQSLIEKLQNMTISLPSEITRLSRKISDLEVEEFKTSKGIGETGQLEKLREQVKSLEKDIIEKEALLPGLEEELLEKRTYREGMLADFKEREKKGQDDLSELNIALRELRAQKERAEREFVADHQEESLRKQERRLEEEYNDLINKKVAAENKNDMYAKLIEKKKYIDRQMRLFHISRKIEQINQQLEELRIPNEQEQVSLREDYEQKLSKLSRNIQKKSNLEGRMEVVKTQFKEARINLEKTEVKNAELNFRNNLINKAVCEKIIEDLDSFVTVLDESILKFHKDKMAAINIILDNLWRKVYNGIDIETIQIRTEKNEGADKRASYDYNVIMVLEGGIEVGMRDRCSAGQKMLASLLIRIALADVFAKTCSIIALDEPTTNLDTAKIEQMATMLNTLINARRADDEYGNIRGKQFQMIVITHDERLVNALKLGCRPEKTFRISKDPMTGKSRLEAFDYVGNKVLPFN